MTTDDPRRMKAEEWADYYEERDDGLRLYRQRAFTAPPEPLTLSEQLAAGIPTVDWVIEGIGPAGFVQVNAMWKAGKTTLAMNWARSLVTGEPFLNRFPVHFGADERVAYLNMELGSGQMLRWWAEMKMADDALKRIVPYHAREHGFGALDLSNEQAVQWLISWITKQGATYAILDPLAKLYNPASWGGTGDPNASYNQFWIALERIRREANLRGVLIAHHTGFGEEAPDRARGASAMMDCPDVNMSYRLDTDDSGKPDSRGPRYLSALGRDVDIEEFEIGYAANRVLHATGRGSRFDAAKPREARRCWSAVRDSAAKGKRPNKGELFDMLGWKQTGKSAARYNGYYTYALERQYVATEKVGTATLHAPGPRTPDQDCRVTVSLREESA